MANLASLAKDTAIYGLSSIVGRFLNYMLVPLYTAKISAASGGYGVITEIYSYVALMLVLLTFGMETTFFRFINKEEREEDALRVYSTTLTMVGFVGLLFIALVMVFIGPIAEAMNYADHPEYIQMMAVCVAVDAFLCMPFAYLRYRKNALKFASLKFFIIVLNISLNLIYFLVLPEVVDGFTIQIGYVFAMNLFCTLITVVFLRKELTGFRWTFDATLMRSMLKYSWPLLILGIAGILNQTADKMIFRHVVENPEEGKVQLGIYGACTKIAMIMAMITQAFRYAYEPYVFSIQKDRDSRETYANAMKYFLIFTLLAFLVVVGYMDILKFIIKRDYWDGLRVVPIVMAAEIMMGIYTNLSFWYKLTDRTIWGAWFSGAGCLVLILINVFFIPRYGYMACAWAGVAGYGTAMLLSYFVGQRYYKVNYPLKSMGVYVFVAALFFTIMQFLPEEWPAWARLCVNTVIIILFVAHIIHYDFPLRNLPVVGKYFRPKK